jgi:2-oxoisovalerate dehydrogenase E2 component (dihydrolipoyl transacylase)
MRREFAMPDVGEGLTEAEVVTWNVAVGDTVTVNQILCEIETAKAAVELPSPFAGTVGELLVKPGETIAVGTPIIVIETAEAAPGGVIGAPAAGVGRHAAASAGQAGAGAGGSAGQAGTGAGGGAAAGAGGADQADQGGAKIGEAGVDGRIATLVGYGPRPGSVTRRPRRAAAGGPRVGVGAGAGPRPGSQQGDTAVTQSQQGDTAPIQSQQGDTAPIQSQQGDTAPIQSQQGDTAPIPPSATVTADPALPVTNAPSAARTVPLAKPPVRKLARDLGVDLHEVMPSRADGVITRDDVQAHARGGVQAAQTPAASPAQVSPGLRREPIRGVRKATAAAMVASAFTAPHVTEFLTVDVTETMALRDRLRAAREFADVKLTPLAFVAKAMCLAARRTPEVNSHWDEAAAEIVFYDRVQLGIAAATPRGLIVPKIRNADTLTLHELAAALGELTATARAGKTPPADLVGGTITITNVGVFGVDTGTPILNPGEAAILAVGSIKQAPWVVEGALAVRTVCQLSLSFDHRLVDGEQGSRFLADVGALLEDPGRALTF